MEDGITVLFIPGLKAPLFPGINRVKYRGKKLADNWRMEECQGEDLDFPDKFFPTNGYARELTILNHKISISQGEHSSWSTR